MARSSVVSGGGVRGSVAEVGGPNLTSIPLVGVEGLDLPRQWCFGAALDGAGDVFMVPYGGKMPLILACRSLKYVDGCGGDGYKWVGLAMGGNGMLYAAPHNAEAILEVPVAPILKKERVKEEPRPLSPLSPGGSAKDKAKDKALRKQLGFEVTDRELSFIGGVDNSPGKWFGAATGPDGNIYCAPYNADSVLVIDTEARSHYCIRGAGDGLSKWSGAAAANDGKIYFAPFDAVSVLVVDCETGGLSHIDGLPEGKAKWHGAVASPDGRVFFAPYNADAILVVDTKTQKWSYLGSFGKLTGKWTGAALGYKGGEEDGAIYFAPYNADSLMWLNLEDDSLHHVRDEQLIGPGLGKWFAVATGVEGKLICTPWNADLVLIINTKIEKWTRNR